MATDVEIREIKANVSKFVQKYDGVGGALASLLSDLRALRTEVTTLENKRDHVWGQVREAEARLAEVEAQAKSRMSNATASHREIVERLTKKECELREQQARMEVKEAELNRRLSATEVRK